MPPIVLALTQYPEAQNFDLSSLRLCFVGAAPMSADLQNKLESTTGITTVQGYGLTESSPATNADFMEPDLKKPGSIGPPLPDTEEMVVDLEAGGAELPRGELGELIIKGPQVMKGYSEQPRSDRIHSAPTAGCTPGTSPPWMKTVTFTSLTGRRS